jgi:hypothetical protein
LKFVKSLLTFRFFRRHLQVVHNISTESTTGGSFSFRLTSQKNFREADGVVSRFQKIDVDEKFLGNELALPLLNLFQPKSRKFSRKGENISLGKFFFSNAFGD